MIFEPKFSMKGRQAYNPHNERNAAKMKKRGAKWVHISKEPTFVYDEMERIVFKGFTERKTYVKPK